MEKLLKTRLSNAMNLGSVVAQSTSAITSTVSRGLKEFLAAVLAILVLFMVTSASVSAEPLSGHLKYRAQVSHSPNDSLFRQQQSATTYDHSADMRLQWSTTKNHWSVQLDYQVLAIAGDGVELANRFDTNALNNTLISGGFPDDDQRLWDLTHRFSDNSRHLLLHRLDRAHLTYTGEQSVFRLGRQVLSWGNGLIYNPMDFFNPFDPAAVDTEYKTGDDMAYGQVLFNNGDDLQAVYVARRDENHKLTSDVASTAIKYHGWWGQQEWDVLLAEHYDDTMIGLGTARDIGGAVWRGDIVATHSDDQSDVSDPMTSPSIRAKNDDAWITSLVTNLSYSWMWWNRNISGIAEYYYNGFGETGNELSVEDIRSNPRLLNRLNRGELYNLGRHYLAASLTVEVTPLLNLTPGLFLNLSDHSSLWQVIVQYDPTQNIQVLGSLNVPIGSSGTEFGGLKSSIPGLELSQDISMSMQIAWYF